jgi:hypothetical protein
LETELEISDTTIRRNLRIAELPIEAVMTMQRTGSAKKALAQHRQAVLRSQAEADRRQRLGSEERTGKISDFVAAAIFEFCKQNKIFAVELEKLLPWIRLNANLIPKGSWPKNSSKRKLTLDELFRLLRPPEGPDEFWIEHRAKWLARISGLLHWKATSARGLSKRSSAEQARLWPLRRRQLRKCYRLVKKGSNTYRNHPHAGSIDAPHPTHSCSAQAEHE